MKDFFCIIKAIIVLEARLYCRALGVTLLPALFFLLAVAIMALATSPLEGVTAEEGRKAFFIPFIPLFALFSLLLSTGFVFHPLKEDGSLDQLVLAGQSLMFFSLVKIFVHWFFIGLPVSILSTLFFWGVLMESFLNILPIFLVGTAIFSFNATFGAALTIQQAFNAHLSVLLILPFCVPALLFMILCLQAVSAGLVDGASFRLLLALLAGLAAFVPFMASRALHETIRE